MNSPEKPASAEVTAKEPAFCPMDEPLGLGPDAPTVVDLELRRRLAREGLAEECADTADEDGDGAP